MKFSGERVVLDYDEVSIETRLHLAASGVSEADYRFILERTISQHLARYYFTERLLAGRDGPLTVLDAACGTGYGSFILAGRGAIPGRSVVGVDIDAEAIDYAASEFARPDLALTFQHADCRDLPWNDPTFDVIASFETLEHLSRDDGAGFVARLSQLLRPGGFLVISTPSPRPDLDNPYHLHEYDLAEFDALLALHFAHRGLFDQGFVTGTAILPRHDAVRHEPVPWRAEARVEQRAPLTPHPTFSPPIAGVAPAPAVRYHVAICGHEPLPAEIPAAMFCYEPAFADVAFEYYLR